MRFCIKDGNKVIHLAGNFETAADAAEHAADRGIFGVPVELDQWQSEPEQQTGRLRQAKQRKRRELQQEGRQRVRAVAPIIDDIEILVGILFMVKDIGLTSAGTQVAAIVAAYRNGIADIAALNTIEAVNSYDVVSTPGWP